MHSYMTVSDAARAFTRDFGIEVHPRDISDLFYQRILADDLGPIVGGRRLIDRESLPLILEALRRRGKVVLPAGNVGAVLPAGRPAGQEPGVGEGARIDGRIGLVLGKTATCSVGVNERS